MSNIDPSQPTYGNATTLSVRNNMATAKAEIEALQALIDAMRADIGEIEATLDRLLTASWVAGVNPNNVNLGVLAQGGTVVSVTGVSELLNGGPATVTPYWVASGGGLAANGTALTTSGFDARAAQGVIQTLSLSGSVVVPPGGRIGLRTTGIFDTSVANITVRIV